MNDENKIIENNYEENINEINLKCKELNETWSNLLTLSLERRKLLECSLRSEMFYFEINEIEQWFNEKVNLLQSISTSGRDEDAIIKLMNKLKALELEIDSYDGLIKELNIQAKKLMSEKKYLDNEQIEKRLNDLNGYIENLNHLLARKREKLIESKQLDEYFRESEEFLKWLNEQIQISLSDEYGEDYERLLFIMNKFNEFQRCVEGANERFKIYEEMANKLLQIYNNDNSEHNKYIIEINQRQLQLNESWQALHNQIQIRKEKLLAAEEIHRFNRDVAEALSRIQEKYSILSIDDIGKDLRSVQTLYRKHEVFENDLVALESQLQALIDDSARLQALYPGGNAEHILKQQQIVVEHWNTLQKRALMRKDSLLASLSLQKFISSVKDLESWSKQLEKEMSTQEKVRDVLGAQELKTEHERIKAEMEAREADFTAVVKKGEELIQEQNHYAAKDIGLYLTHLLECRESLHTSWQLKKIYLDQLIDLHFFLRDVKQLNQLSASQEQHLLSHEIGSTVEQIENNIRKHDAFEKLLQQQDEKLIALQACGNKLLQQNHFDSQTIKLGLNDVNEKRSNIHKLSAKRREHLLDQRLLAQFRRDIIETETWINDRIRSVNAEIIDRRSVQAAKAQLNRHKEYKAEIDMRHEYIEKLKTIGGCLISRKIEVDEVNQTLERLNNVWKQLHVTWNKKEKLYEENLDSQIFKRDSEQLENWLEEKLSVLKENALGSSIAEVEEIIRTHEDILRNLQDERLEALRRLTLIETNLAKEEEEEAKRKQKLEEEELKRKSVNETNASRSSSRLSKSSTLDRRSDISGDGAMLIEAEGFLDRKHDVLFNGRKSTVRSWKTFYTVLCGQLLCFFKDIESYKQKIAASPPVSIHDGKCFLASNYTKRKHVFRLRLADGAEFLFAAPDEKSLNDWMNKLSFHASLSPSMQLLSYESQFRQQSPISSSNGENESQGQFELSRESSPDVTAESQASLVSQKRPPPPPPNEHCQSSRPPAPLPNSRIASQRSPPPLPPPRTVTYPSNSNANNDDADHVHLRRSDSELDRNARNNANNNNLMHSQMQPNWQTNGNNGIVPMQEVTVVRSAVVMPVSMLPIRSSASLPPNYPIQQQRMMRPPPESMFVHNKNEIKATQSLHAPAIYPAHQLDPQVNYNDLRYAQAMHQNRPFSFPPSGQGSDDLAFNSNNGARNVRPSSMTTTSSEEDVSNTNANKTDKKKNRRVLSFFKRHK